MLEAEVTQPRRISRWPLAIVVGLGVFSLLAVATLAGVAYYHRDTFYPGTSVEGIALGGISYSEGEKRVGDFLNARLNRAVIVTVADMNQPRDAATGRYPEIELTTTATDIGALASSSDAITAAWSVGHTSNVRRWLGSVLPALFSGKAFSISYSVDRASIAAFVATTVRESAKTPVPAKIEVDGTTVKVVEGAPGVVVDEVVLSDDLVARLTADTGTGALYIRAPFTEQNSDITTADLQPIADHLTALGNLSLTLSVGSVKRTPTKAELLTWFSPVQDEEGEISLASQPESIAKYLQVSGSTLDQKASLTAVTNAIGPLATGDVSALAPDGKLAVSLVAAPLKAVIPGQYTLGTFPNKYIEVNLKEQKLYQIEGNTLIATYRISSGKWSTPTPTGTFTIAGKAKRAYSRSFGLYMPYWMNFRNDDYNTTEYGLHALPEWPNGYKEGESHLGTPVSHGCVRLGDADAAVVYGWADSGTHVVIH